MNTAPAGISTDFARRRRHRQLCSTALLALASLALFRFANADVFGSAQPTAGLVAAWLAARALGPVHGAVVAGVGALAWPSALLPGMASMLVALEVFLVSLLARRLRGQPVFLVDFAWWLALSGLLAIATREARPDVQLDLLRYAHAFAVDGMLSSAIATLLLGVPLHGLLRGRWIERARVRSRDIASALTMLVLAVPLLWLSPLSPHHLSRRQEAAPHGHPSHDKAMDVKQLLDLRARLLDSIDPAELDTFETLFFEDGCTRQRKTYPGQLDLVCPVTPVVLPVLGRDASGWHRAWLREGAGDVLETEEIPGTAARVQLVPMLDDPLGHDRMRDRLLLAWLGLAALLLASNLPLAVSIHFNRQRWLHALGGLEHALSLEGSLPGDSGWAQVDVVRTLRRIASRLRREEALLIDYKRQLQQILANVPIVLTSGIADAATGQFRIDVLQSGPVNIDGCAPDAPPPRDASWWPARLHPDDLPALRDGARALVEKGVWQGRYRVRARHGGWRTLQSDARVVERLGWTRCRYTSFSVDITEEAERSSREQDSARLLTLGRLAAGIAHELNQPLNVIRLAAENALAECRDKPDRDYVQKRLHRITAQVDRAAKITGQLRVVGRSTGETSLFEIDAALRASIELLEQDLLADNIALIYHGAPLKLTLRGSHQIFEQCVINLVLNARDSLLERRELGIPRNEGDWIELLASTDIDGNIRVSVRDTGTGIAPEVAPHLFDIFFTTKDIDKGSGIGLSFVHGAVTAMGGRIVAYNHPVGACFEMIFDAQPHAEAALAGTEINTG